MHSSGRNNPCPVCGRTKDSDCRWNNATILCHTGTDLRPGDTLTYARQKWAFIHHKGGFSGMAAVFKPHRALGARIKRETPTLLKNFSLARTNTTSGRKS